MSRSILTTNNRLISCLSLFERQVETAAELASVGRDPAALKRIASLGLGMVSKYCEALGLNRRGEPERAEEIARELIEAGPHYRAKGFVLLANNCGPSDPDRALALFKTAAACVDDPCTALAVSQNRAVVLSAQGDHRRALLELENAVRLLPSVHPFNPLRDNFYNSLAVECTYLNRLCEASVLCRLTSASLWRVKYPEWKETADNLREIAPRHDVVSFSAPPSKARLLLFPTIAGKETPASRLGLLRMDCRRVISRMNDERLLAMIPRIDGAPESNRELAIRASEMEPGVARELLDRTEKRFAFHAPRKIERKEEA